MKNFWNSEVVQIVIPFIILILCVSVIMSSVLRIKERKMDDPAMIISTEIIDSHTYYKFSNGSYTPTFETLKEAVKEALHESELDAIKRRYQ